ncbi:hypothetical protein LCGC14_1287030 [marine sediment metagenome]|uniref:Uncharacterized protein n=1 Tax=marine sediment metagenome TaxID=412755 RepID=A0A0F9LEF5_9ZZZZ
MSEERPVLHVPKMGGSQTISVSKAREIADNIEELTDAELDAKLSRVLERGIIVDRTTVDLPAGVHGEWVCDDDVEIARMQLMGFEIDGKYAVDRSSHADGTGATAKIGDIVFMTCPQRVKDTIEKVRKRMYDRANPKSGSQKEEKDFKQSMGNIREARLPVTDESVQSSVNEAGIIAALEGKINK